MFKEKMGQLHSAKSRNKGKQQASVLEHYGHSKPDDDASDYDEASSSIIVQGTTFFSLKKIKDSVSGFWCDQLPNVLQRLREIFEDFVLKRIFIEQ